MLLHEENPFHKAWKEGSKHPMTEDEVDAFAASVRKERNNQKGYTTSDYNYDLPQELIAQDPLTDRASSRLMVLDRKTGAISHHAFKEIASFLKAGDLLVLNDTRVIPARLHGVKKDTGAKVEVLLLKEVTSHLSISEAAQSPLSSVPYPSLSATRTERRPPNVVCAPQGEGSNSKEWECLVRPGKKLRLGSEILFFQDECLPPGGKVSAPKVLTDEGLSVACEVSSLRATVTDILDDGNRLIRFTWDNAPDGHVRTFEEVLDTLGEMPLPPYITHKLQERDRYNTVYARYDGSAAAPTAGLHFTPELLDEVKAKGINIATVTLHVGLGTFRPVKTRDVRDHKMHSEWYHIPEETARLINGTKANGGRVICVGTTSCRTLESAALRDTSPVACGDTLPSRGGQGETDIFIYPGFTFRVMDGLITNFHLPQSTLLMLVSAFATREQVLSAYAEAVRERYRFFSFGDAMLII